MVFLSLPENHPTHNGLVQRGPITSIKLVEEFDWSNPKTNREYIQLEQKTLARKASQDEMDRYFAMKNERDGAIFADRYLADYAEIQRLKILSEKIAEIQKFLRPIKIG